MNIVPDMIPQEIMDRLRQSASEQFDQYARVVREVAELSDPNGSFDEKITLVIQFLGTPLDPVQQALTLAAAVYELSKEMHKNDMEKPTP